MDFVFKFIMNEQLNHNNDEIGWKNYLNLYIKFINMYLFINKILLVLKLCCIGSYGGCYFV